MKDDLYDFDAIVLFPGDHTFLDGRNKSFINPYSKWCEKPSVDAPDVSFKSNKPVVENKSITYVPFSNPNCLPLSPLTVLKLTENVQTVQQPDVHFNSLETFKIKNPKEELSKSD